MREKPGLPNIRQWFALLGVAGASNETLRLQRSIAILLVCADVFPAAYGPSESAVGVRIDSAAGQLLAYGSSAVWDRR